MEYDIFISCKSEDYTFAGEIYDYLTQQGFNTFLASKELRNLGDSEYRRAISSAMKSAYHMIVFASRAEYIDSTWVYYEWDMYVNAMLKGYKKGQIITILKDLKSEEINMDLWKYESFNYDDYKDRILSYLETPAYIERREEAKRKRMEEERLEAEKIELQRIKEQKDMVASIRISVSALNNAEDKAKINREQLLFQIQSVDDKNIRNELIDLLDNSGPLHLEIRFLKRELEEKERLLSLEENSHRNNIELQTELELEKRMRIDLEKKYIELKKTNVPKRKWLTHFIYCSIIVFFVIGFMMLSTIKEDDTVAAETQTQTKIELPSIFDAPQYQFSMDPKEKP